MRIIREVTGVSCKDNYYEAATNECAVRIWFLTDDIIRIRVGFDGDFKEESYSLVTTAWADRLDGVMESERTRIDVVDTTIEEDIEFYTIASRNIKLVIRKKPVILEVYDKKDTLLHRDIPELAYRCDSNNRRFHTSEITDGDCFYGFGEKTGPLNKKGQFMTMSPNDTMGYDPVNADSLYKHIPFYIKANRFSGSACGYFYHNMRECTFDMGRSHSNYWKHHSTYETDGGDIDLFFMSGETIGDVVKSYTYLTGRSALLPKYSLGYLGSSMYYSELETDCDKKIEGFIDTARDEEIPIDGFQLSSGYTTYDTVEGKKRCVFTWNKDRFPDPEGFFEEMKKRNIAVSPNVKPGILMSHPDIEKYAAKGMFVRASKAEREGGFSYNVSAAGLSYNVSEWWGGKGVFADFTNPVCRNEWKNLLKENVIKKGTTSVWNDNCEYDSIIDKDAQVDYDGEGAAIGDIRVIMANLMCKITGEAIREVNPGVRPFIVCRAGHSGIQRYAQSWAGDNKTSWDTLAYNQATILGMSMCGVSNYGADIGGFFGEAPSAELLVRWVQAGIFMPRFSIHSVNTDNTVTEPWMYSEYTHYIRDAIKFRYRLFPYLYSLMAAGHFKGDMIINPLFAVYPKDEKCYDICDTYLLGESLLVANVLEKGQTSRKVYFPKGSNYYGFSYKDDHILGGCRSAGKYKDKYAGGQYTDISAELGDIPLFLTSGAIIPLAGNQLMNLSEDDVSDLHIIAVADKDASFDYYEDDGITFDYQKNIYHRMHIDMQCGLETTIAVTHEGNYESAVKTMRIEIISGYNCPNKVTINGNKLPQFLRLADYTKAEKGWYYNIQTHATCLTYPYISEAYTITVDYDSMDMLGM